MVVFECGLLQIANQKWVGCLETLIICGSGLFVTPDLNGKIECSPHVHSILTLESGVTLLLYGAKCGDFGLHPIPSGVLPDVPIVSTKVQF